MEQYIKKSALVSEIEKRIQVHYNDMNKYKSDISKIALGLCIEENKTILSFLNTIEAKEVDLEKEVDKWYNNEASKEFENVLYEDIEKCAKHFYELGLNTK